MGYGQGSVGGSEMNAHKVMAGADKGGSFGVKSAFTGGNQTQKGVQSFAEMNDGARGAGTNVGGRQAAPDHGDAGKDHFTRGGGY
jgi:hypothetical protein